MCSVFIYKTGFLEKIVIVFVKNNELFIENK